MNETIPCNEKCLKILDTARQLFYKYGIKRISIEEICKTADVSKMTFYKFFENKTDVVLKILQKVYDDSDKRINEIIAEPVPFPAKVKMMIEMKRVQTEFMSKELWSDLVLNPIPEVKEFLDGRIVYFTTKFISIFKKAQQDGDIRPDVKPEFIMYLFNYLYEIGKDENLIKLYDSTSALADEMIKFYFYGILTRNE